MTKRATQKTPGGAQDQPKAIVVDDHPLVRKGFVELLEEEFGFVVCGEAEDQEEALQLTRNQKPDLMIVDISLREGSGLHLVQQLHAEYPEIKILVVSMHDERLYAERCVAAGALGYVSKECDTEELIAAIKTVLESKVYVSEEISARILQRVASGAEDLNCSPIESLSDRELEVFRLLGTGLGSREIADQLHLSVKTIDTYREHIKAKLGLKDAKELVRYAVTWSLDQDAGPVDA